MKINRRTPLAVAAILALGVGAWSFAQSSSMPRPTAMQDDIAVFFSPDGGIADAIAASIDGARREVKMQAFILSNNEISNALVRAARRGVSVQVIFDHEFTQEDYSDHVQVGKRGVDVYVAPEGRTMHNKVILIDGQLLITGSANFTVSADRENFENMLFIKGRSKIYQAYEKYFEGLKKLCDDRDYKQVDD